MPFIYAAANPDARDVCLRSGKRRVADMTKSKRLTASSHPERLAPRRLNWLAAEYDVDPSLR